MRKLIVFSSKEDAPSISKREKRFINNHEILAVNSLCILFVPDALPVLHKRFKGVEKAPLGIWYDFIHWHVPKNRIDWYK
jgi:peptide/nickel transport system substrate-binding protein